MHAVRIVALAILAVLLANCSSRPTIQVLLTGEPELFGQIVGLRVFASVEDSTATRKTVMTAEPINGRFGVFNLVLPEAPTGILSVVVSGLRQGDCQVARGETSLPIEEALQGQVVVAMQATPEGCLVRVRKRGGGQGTVSDRPARGTREDTLHCPATSTEPFCQHQYTLGTVVRLIAEPEPGSVFLGWTVSNCRGRGPCDLVVSDDIQEVQARFESTRQCNQQYLCWENPLPIGNDLLAVSVLSNGDIWAVGAQGTILRREEGVWYVVRRETSIRLLGVYAVSASDVWIVGQCGVVLHWNGETLVNNSPLGSTCSGFHFRGVWGSGPDDVWLVGTGGQLWHWDGKSLGPVESGVTVDLTSIHGTNANKFFIAGSQGTLLYRNGAIFQRVSIPDASADLVRVFIDQSNQVWVTTQTTVLRGTADGSPLVVDLQHPAVRNIEGLWGTSDGSIWTAGNEGLVMRRGSLGWESLSSGLSVFSKITSIAGRSNDDLWLVGLAGLRMHWNGAYLTREQGGFESPQLLSIHGSSASDVWTGGLATLVRKVGDALFPTELTLGSFTGLHAVAGGTIFGTTSDGRIIQADGMNISELCPGPTRLNGIDLFDQDHIWAIGNAGRVVRRTPNGCTGVSLPGGNLHGVYALAADTIFAVGDNGGLFRVASNSAGTNFQIGQGTLAPANLLGISGSRPDNVWIVGENGTVLHLDTTTGNYKSLGDLLPNSKSVAFRGVWASHELDSNGQLKHRDAWIVGDYGTMILARALGTGDVSTVRYQLVRQYSGTDLNLNAVWGSGPGDVWAVGDFGAVLHYVPPATELP